MRKISYLFLLVLFALFACQTDSVNPEILEDEATELNQTIENAKDIGVFVPIPEKYKNNLDAYLNELIGSPAKGDPVRFGCVTFVDGFAIIDDDCTITSGVPRRIKDCDLQAVQTITCGTNPFNPLCTICAVIYVAECDGQLGSILGYNIICAIGPIEIPIGFPL